MKIIKRLFIKDYENTSDRGVRFRYGITAGIFGIAINVLLCALKAVVGALSGSVAVAADAVNNLSDAASSVVTVSGFKLSNRPADEEHPFGHARYEYVAAFVTAIVVVAIGVLLMKTSIEKIIRPSAVSVNVWTYVVLGAAVLLKAFQALMCRDFGRAVNSEALKAAAADSRNDVLSTSAVIVSSVVTQTTGVNIDGYMGAVLSAVIVIFSLKLLKDTVNPLLGTPPEKDFVRKITERLKSYDVVLDCHDLMVHSYGPAVSFASVHAEVDAAGDLISLHDAIDNIEKDFMEEMNVHLTIHMDPVAKGDPETDRLKGEVAEIIRGYDERISLHDFRLVRGPTHTNVLFDVVVPFGCRVTAEDLRGLLCEGIRGDADYRYVISVDRPYLPQIRV